MWLGMINAEGKLRFGFAQNAFALIEFALGALIVLMGLYGLFPSPQLNIIIIIGIFATLPLIIYLPYLMIKGVPIRSLSSSRWVDVVACVLVGSSLFLIDILSETGIATVAIICGSIIVAHSFWHMKFSTQDKKKFNEQ